MATVSVIIPLYNKSQYVRRALESVFAQSYEDFEVVVVDDGSTDDGPEQVRQYTDSRLTLVHQANAGPGAARNRGISESKGELLTFLDADDEWMPWFLESSMAKLKNNPCCDLIASTSFLGKERMDVSPIYEKLGITAGAWKLQNNMPLKQLLSMRYIFLTCSILCKREIVERYGGFRQESGCNYGEDTYLWLQIMLNHKIFRILEPLAWYHSEVSELGPGRRTVHPLEPFLTDPDPIRASCPKENRQLLEKFLAGTALATAHECAVGNGNKNDLRYLLRKFPLMKKFRWEYAKLRVKMRLPGLIPVVRSIKNTCSTVRTLYIG